VQVNPEFQQHTKVTKPLACGMPRLGLLSHDAAPPRIHNKGLCIDSESELELPWRPGVPVVGAGCSGQLPTLQVDHLQPSYRSSRQAQSLCRAWSHVTDARPGPCKYHSVVQCEKLLFTNTFRAGFLFRSVGNVENCCWQWFGLNRTCAGCCGLGGCIVTLKPGQMIKFNFSDNTSIY
jgi:hypothetical protein